MGIGVFLLAFGLTAVIGGGWVALNIRGSAVALERMAETNTQMRMRARGDLGPAPRRMSSALYRLLGTVITLAGCMLTLVSLVEVTG
ncbi:hypothetical protein [Streptomyces sp. ISL-94]|uniref:hypothetical protein n=1 Tax=Streptomyces sp. ISL-94 TaxID=2819190 RepID=UPI001BE9940C|nr:hypothetical protein [Streptomyces sp. ISL-94]MBT2482124.1 hypothetical protein [Streptomyces sp. ISL-94]